jgi:peptide/nickel transport system substrate-binding protein
LRTQNVAKATIVRHLRSEPTVLPDVNRQGLRRLSSALAIAGGLLMIVAQPGALGSTSRVQQGTTFRIAFESLDYIDPALSYSPEGWFLLDVTCARLMAYPDKPPPEGFLLMPEVAADFPKISRNGKTYTFTLRTGFRFSDGTPVRASAFAHAINRTLAPGVDSPAQEYTQDIAGAADVKAGRTRAASGVVAQGNRLVVRFTRPVFDFAAMTTMPFFCAVPPTLPSYPEGVGAFPAAGPYFVSEYRPGERVVLKRNPFYGGVRPQHVDGFDVDVRAPSQGDLLDRVERGDADWGFATSPVYFEPGRGLVAKYGVNRSRFFVKPGLVQQTLVFNVARPLFANNPRLRQAVNFALDRRALQRAVSTSPLDRRLTDQYLPPSLPGFRDADIYPLEHANLSRAKALARGTTRGGKALLYATDRPQPLAAAQVVKRQLAAIGLDVEIVAIPRGGSDDGRWDLTSNFWGADYLDPYAYINLALDGRFAGKTNGGRFNSPTYNRLMRQASRLQGPARYRAYGALDVRLARDAAPLAALSFLNEPTLVSKRVGCIVLRPYLDLAAACLK